MSEKTDITAVYPDENFNRQAQQQQPSSVDTRFADVEALANLMDTQFKLPGTAMRFGLHSMLDFVPGVGNSLAMAMSFYIIHRAKQMGVPRHIITRMGMNIALDWAIGNVPLAGSLVDLAWKSNRANLELLKKHARF